MNLELKISEVFDIIQMKIMIFKLYWLGKFLSKSFQTHEKMDIKEYAKLIDMAIENKNYAVAIYLLRDLMNIKSFTKVMDQKFLKWFEVTKSNLIKLNNGYLERSQTFLRKNQLYSS